MKTKYIDLIDQTFDWPQDEFDLVDNELRFHNIPLMDLVRQYGTPLKFTYLPRIGYNIQRTKRWFRTARKKIGYEGDYHYCYVTKSSHFKYILDEVLKYDVHIETSSAYDLDIVRALYEEGKLDKDATVVCNGFKKDTYLERMKFMINDGFTGIMAIIDNREELQEFAKGLKVPVDIGIRIASEEEPKFEFYTSRLGIRYKEITNFYKENIRRRKNIRLKMLHFFVNTGINDTAYYWNELTKCLKVYVELRKVCPTLDSLNIGGGFPIKNSLAFSYDYQYIIDTILEQIKASCDEAKIPVPHIYTEFGSFTVGESGGAIYKVLNQKKQNDREKWNMIDSSFMTTLPDTWAINKRFIMLPLNRWEDEYERVFLGGLTCDSDDYYNSEQHFNAIYLPRFEHGNDLYLGFFHTGAYQDTLGGYGGIHHCLMPQPKHLLIDEDNDGNFEIEVFSEEQSSDEVLRILGYRK